MPRRRTTAAVVLLALALAGCSSDPDVPASAELVPGATSAPVVTSTTPTAQAMDALAVVDVLKKAGLPVSNIAEQDEDTDPNDKLGRPGGYTSRASADVPGGDKQADKYSIDRGLVVEVFATVEDADARAKFIQETLKSMQILGTEYHYRGKDKRILVRIVGAVKPSTAKRFEPVAATL